MREDRRNHDPSYISRDVDKMFWGKIKHVYVWDSTPCSQSPLSHHLESTRIYWSSSRWVANIFKTVLSIYSCHFKSSLYGPQVKLWPQLPRILGRPRGCLMVFLMLLCQSEWGQGGRSVSLGCCNKISQTRGLKNRQLFITVMENGSLKSRSKQVLFLLRALSLACRGPPSHCVLVWFFSLCRNPWCPSFFLEGHQPYRLKAPLYDPKVLSPSLVTLRLKLRPVNFWGWHS